MQVMQNLELAVFLIPGIAEYECNASVSTGIS